MYGRRFLMDVPQEQRLWSLMTISHHLFLSTQHKGFHPVSPTLRICDQVDTSTPLADPQGECLRYRILPILWQVQPEFLGANILSITSGTRPLFLPFRVYPLFSSYIISTDRPPPSARCLRHRRLRPRQCKAPC